VEALAKLPLDATAPETRKTLQKVLETAPIGAVLGALPAHFPSTISHGQRVLRTLLERFYGPVDQDAIHAPADGIHARRAWIGGGKSIAAILLPSIGEAAQAIQPMPEGIEEVDLILAAPPSKKAISTLAKSITNYARLTIVWGTGESGLQ